MEERHGAFAVKLQELERQYEWMLCRLRSCQGADRETVQRELEELLADCRKREQLLLTAADTGRSTAVADFSEAQLDYCRRVRHIIERESSSRGGADASPQQAEAAALYGEYAVDFALLAIRQALMAVLSAMDLQMEGNEQANP